MTIVVSEIPTAVTIDGRLVLAGTIDTSIPPQRPGNIVISGLARNNVDVDGLVRLLP